MAIQALEHVVHKICDGSIEIRCRFADQDPTVSAMKDLDACGEEIGAGMDGGVFHGQIYLYFRAL